MKLSPHFYAPYLVRDWIGSVAYCFRRPTKARIHDVFHVSLLKKFEGTPPDAIIPFPPIQHSRVIPAPDKCLKARLNYGIWEVLVAWQGHPSADTTWEKVTEFKAAYPEVLLMDKLFLGGEGNVVDSFIGKVYHRRKLAAN
jgi:hypothetical protein